MKRTLLKLVSLTNRIPVNDDALPDCNLFRPVRPKYYYDETLHCDSCACGFVFPAKLQKHYAEELKLRFDVRPRLCLKCLRSYKNICVELLELENHLQPKGRNQTLTVQQLDRLWQLYLAASKYSDQGYIQKAKKIVNIIKRFNVMT